MLQNLAALLLGKIDVENDQRRTRRCIGVRLVEIPDGLLPVLDNMEGEKKLARLDSFLDQKHVRFVILDDEHMAPNVDRLLRRGA